MRNQDAAVRLEGESTFRDILAMLELDPRYPKSAAIFPLLFFIYPPFISLIFLKYQDPAMRNRLVGVFLPFLPIVIDFWPSLRDGEFMERRVVLATFVCVLKYTTPRLLEGWWKEESRIRYNTYTFYCH